MADAAVAAAADEWRTRRRTRTGALAHGWRQADAGGGLRQLAATANPRGRARRRARLDHVALANGETAAALVVPEAKPVRELEPALLRAWMLEGLARDLIKLRRQVDARRGTSDGALDRLLDVGRTSSRYSIDVDDFIARDADVELELALLVLIGDGELHALPLDALHEELLPALGLGELAPGAPFDGAARRSPTRDRPPRPRTTPRPRRAAPAASARASSRSSTAGCRSASRRASRARPSAGAASCS